MRRRDLFPVLGAAVSWPLAGRAQQLARPEIGFLSSRSPTESTSVVAAFRQGLKEAGHIDGQNLTVEYRWAEGRYDGLPELANELVGRHVSLIAATGDVVSALAAKGATTTIPIVFVIGGDPVRFGLVERLNRPGGNITGVSLISGGLGAKRLGLMHELMPNAAVFALLVNPNNPNGEPERIDVMEAGRTLGRQILVVNASSEREFDGVFEDLVRHRAGALLVATDPFFLSRRDQLVALAARHAVPTMYQFREFAMANGLISYGTNINDAYRRAGEYSGRILKGESPAGLPVFQQTKLELVINLKTAKTLGLSIPPTLLVFADEVIE
jgi:putative ABC transport system substrate-binding protein